MACRAIGHEFHQIGAAIPNLADDAGTLIFNPCRRPGERMHQTSEMSLPGPDLEAEIVLPIPLAVLKAVFRLRRTLLRESAPGLPHENHAARKGIRRDALTNIHAR